MLIRKETSDELIYQYGRFRSVFPSLARRPMGFFLYVTAECNLSCSYCWQRHQEEGVEGGFVNSALAPLSPDEWRRIVEQIPHPAFLGLSGGEATISPAFATILDAAKQRRLPVTINTNAVSLKEEDFGLLTGDQVRNVSISIDGFADVHDESRGRKGLFEKIIKNIERFNEIRRNRPGLQLTIKTVLVEDTVESLPAFHEFCANELKADTLNISFEKTGEHFQFSLFHCADIDTVFARSKAKLFSYRDTETIVQTASKLLNLGRSSSCPVVFYPRMKTIEQIRWFLESKGRDVYEPCYLPSAMVVVLPDGQVIPCQSVGLGNVRDNDYSVQKVLSGTPYSEFGRKLKAFGSNLPQGCNVCCFSKVGSPRNVQ